MVVTQGPSKGIDRSCPLCVVDDNKIKLGRKPEKICMKNNDNCRRKISFGFVGEGKR